MGCGKWMGTRKGLSLAERSVSYQLVGRVTAYQGDDGYEALEGVLAHWD